MRRVREQVDEMADYCNTEVMLAVVGGKWKLLILKYLLLGTHRFGELKQAMPTVTQRMLTRQLRELEDDGLVRRTVYPEVPPKVEYSLTAVGRSLEEIIERLDGWGSWYREHRRKLAEQTNCTNDTNDDHPPAPAE
ncbi:winged helix-turn-helix transcriptional regulator [Streptomyces sp. NPDC047117]|uniref:winged helix-turn-helix transcriptional regulator n=1 Tax=unclassified Streptomyces TaxID=2593676 RepID=UPI0033C71985